MARKKKEEVVVEDAVVEEAVVEEAVVEEAVVEEVVLSTQEVAIQAAIDTKDPLVALNEFAESDDCSEILKTIIGT